MIKKILLSVFLCLFVGEVFAQADSDSVSTIPNNVVYREVGAKLNIKDKIIVQNKSPYLIMQVMVALPDTDNNFEPLGTSTYITPNDTRTIASYRKNSCTT